MYESGLSRSLFLTGQLYFIGKMYTGKTVLKGMDCVIKYINTINIHKNIHFDNQKDTHQLRNSATDEYLIHNHAQRLSRHNWSKS